MDFEKLSPEERERMFNEKIDKTFLIKRSVLGFETIENDISGIEIGKSFTIPPIFIDKETYFNSIFFSSQDIKGYWTRTMLRTYVEGGIVNYKKVDDNNFEVQIKFQK